MKLENRRVLAIMPHPDDCEILCAGTLLRLKALGFEIHIATMTPGDKGSATLNRTEIAEVRRAEAQRAAEVLGAVSYECLEFSDLEITFDNASRRRVAALLRRVDAGILFTTPPIDYMADHEITSRLVRDACFNAAVPNYASDGDERPTSQIPTLYYTDAIGGHDLFGEPARVQCLADISAQMDRKAEALACHDSQRAWLRTQHGIDEYIDAMRRWGAQRGAQIGVEYAEGFCQHLGHPHPTGNLLAALLGAVPPPPSAV
ncbi:MAG: galB 1 [Chthonomonadaceae bacterium]|nr:galB 1 [Chthonomonadaceae bacterium]